MDPFRDPPVDSLAAARLHVQALTECGLPREALLRALLENYGPTEGDSAMSGMETGGFRPSQQVASAPVKMGQMSQMGQTGHGQMGHGAYNTRLSVSTTSSRSSARASVLSTATSLSSVSSQAPQDMGLSAPPAPTPTPPAKTSNRGTSKSPGAFWCTFCDVAFQRKFDWKRHEDEFHERYKRYPCPSCNRIFWGANTFNQHHKNAHGCTTCPHADSVVKYTHRKGAWACGFCAAFLTSRDRYFDHVAHHYEDGCNKTHWNHSHVIYGLLHQPTINHAWKELHASLYDHLPRAQQPLFEWDPRATGHAQGFLEGDSPGKLQDLLEFFDDTRDDARFLARLAHDQAIIRFRHQLPSAPPVPLMVGRPISEPPRPKTKQSMSSISSGKHMSAPHQLNKQNPFSNNLNQPYDADRHRVLKKQRSTASSLGGLTSPNNVGNSMLHNTHTAAFMAATATSSSNNTSGYPQTIVEAPETCNNPFFSYGHPTTPHHHHQQQHQQQQQQQHLTVPGMTQHGLFEDWSSITTTVVDESSPFSVGDGWDGLSQPPASGGGSNPGN